MRSAHPRLKGLTIILILFGTGLAFTVLLESSGLDLSIPSFFFESGPGHGGWPHGQTTLFRLLYDFGTLPTWLLAFAACLIFFATFRGWIALDYRKPCLVVVLTFALGPGLIVNGLLKEFWGRPRPADLAVFGGLSQYHAVWPPAGPGKGKSFSSGHVATAFALCSGVSFYSLHPFLSGAALVVGLGYGLLMGLARIAQGGHFPTDVLWSGVIVISVLTWLHFLVLRIPEQSSPRRE
ncbi:MAG: phosphatase PAP2 family protein [Thermodesulfobacteriota bacterium]